MSINVQCVCSYDLQFTNIVARWKGSTHDSRIWRNSSLYNRFLNGEFCGYLLGDSGYPCTSYILTPLINPISIPERRYNSSHIKTRNVIERAFGLWKARFQCLQYKLRFAPHRCCMIIVATAILHNYAIREQIPFTDDYNEDTDHFQEEIVHESAYGSTLRRHVIDRVFTWFTLLKREKWLRVNVALDVIFILDISACSGLFRR